MTTATPARMPRTPRARALVTVLVAAFWTLAGVTAPALAGPAPRPVVVIGVGGLLAEDLSPGATPALWRLAAQGAVGTVVVRSVHLSTCPVDGWLTLGAGSRAAQPGDGDHPPCRALPAVPASGSGPVPGWADYARAAATGRQGARLGSLGTAAAQRRLCVQAVGPGAALAAADGSGHVARWAAYDPATLGRTMTACPLTLVDAGVLADGPDRPARVSELDARVGRAVAAAAADATVVVTTVADGSDQARLHPVVVRTRDDRAGVPVGYVGSRSTRKDDIALLTDVAPTVASALGIPDDPSWDGQPMAVTRSNSPVADRVRVARDRDDASRHIAPVALGLWVTWAVVQLLACLVTWLASRRGDGRRARRGLRALLVVMAAVPAATYLGALVPWWRAPVPAVALCAAVAAGAVLLGGLALAGPWRHHPYAPPAVVAVLTALVVGGDAVTGSHLTLSTLLGEQPTIAGRFYGLGNVAFALLATSVLLVMVAVADLGRRRGRARPAALTAIGIGLVAVVVDGSPWWGADLGGPVALLPAVALLGLVALGVRLSWGRAAAVGAVTVGAVCVLALVDWLRPAGSRSHLGRFVQTALDGGAGDVIARKAEQNLHILVSAPFAILVPVGLVAAVWAVARPRSRVGRSLVPGYAAVPLLRPGLAAVLLMWVIGFAMNDSGTAIPAIGAALLVPLVVALLVSVPAAP